MRIALLCATRRGHRFLRKLTELLPESDLIVFSFREEPHEPPFMDEIRSLTLVSGGQFVEARAVGAPRLEAFWAGHEVDLMLAVGWRYMIPPNVYNRPRRGTFVFHDSLLPAYRGFSPTVWAIINGEDQTGVTLFAIAEDADTGDIVDQERVPIDPDETIGDVIERVTESYLCVLERNIDALLSGTARRDPQDHSQATYTCKRIPDDNQIDWTMPAQKIYNLIRAVTAPYPGAYTSFGGRKITVWSGQRLIDGRGYVGSIPGRIVEVRPGEGSVVLTGSGALLLTKVQVDGDEVKCASEVMTRIGETLGR